ncbi:MAG: hypothetical protein J5845_07420 [Lachnospiraceae bacterium]|nr:hypothetical protein [Lachnospiraceae bacterium]
MKRLNRDNKGIALITVVIGVMFCLLLTSTMLRVSLLGLQSREVNKQTSDNYYDAESVIDTVRLNLQNYAAKAWAETTNGADSVNFVKKTYELITGTAYPSSGSLTPANKTGVITKLQANAIQGGTILSIGDIESVIGASGKLEGITIKDVEVKYEHPTTKMVSYVKTDITISAPLYASKKKYPLASYSMFAGSGANIYKAAGESSSNANESGYLEQEGCVYFGWHDWNGGNADAVDITGRQTLILSGDNIVINGNVIITGHSCLQLTSVDGQDVEIRGRILIGSNSHLVISEKTNLKCQDICFFTSDSTSDVKSSSTNYTSLAKQNANQSAPSNFSFETTVNNTTKAGLPYDWYNKTLSTNPYYGSGHSIVYAKMRYNSSTHEPEASAVYDTDIVNGRVTVQTTPSKTLTAEGHISLAMNSNGDIIDEELKAKPRTNQFVNSNGQTVTLKNSYDPFFLEMVDGEYFEKFLDLEPTKNGKCECYVSGNPVSSESIKNGKYRWNGNSLDPGSANVNSNSSQREITYNGVTLNGTSNPKFWLGFTSVGTAIPNPVNVSSRPFVLAKDKITINMDVDGADYCGIVITSANVEFKKDTGYCSGKSLLLLDTSADKHNLVAFMDEVGKRMSGTGNVLESDYKYLIFNNLFNGGVARFTNTSGSGGGSGFIADEEHNKGLNLIGTSNYEKK